jgi:hypothetical protein
VAVDGVRQPVLAVRARLGSGRGQLSAPLSAWGRLGMREQALARRARCSRSLAMVRGPNRRCSVNVEGRLARSCVASTVRLPRLERQRSLRMQVLQRPAPNRSIERTAYSRLRRLQSAAHVER